MLYDSFSHRWKSSKVVAPLVVFLFLRSGLFAPRVEILVGYAPGLDPSKAPLVFLVVDLESVVTCPLERPLLQSTDVPAVLLPFRNRPRAILRADPPGLRKVAPTVFAAPERWAHRRYNSVLPVPAVPIPR